MIALFCLGLVIFVILFFVSNRDARLTKSIDAFRTKDEYIEKELEMELEDNETND